MKNLGSLLLACALGLGLLGCNEQKPSAQEQKAAVKNVEIFRVKFAHSVSADTPKGRAAEFFAKRVEELSKGRIKVEIFPSAQLVDDDRILQELMRNNIQMAAPSLSKFAPIVKEFNVWDIPFLFRDRAQVYGVMDGEVGQMLKGMISKKGIVALDYWDGGFKQLSSSKQPIHLPDDLKGQKVRVMSSKVLEEQMKALGATPTMINFNETYQALAQGGADAAENTLINFYSAKLNEVQSSLTLSNHGYLGYLVVVSEGFWRGLPEDLKPLFTQALRESTEFERKESVKDEKLLLEKLTPKAPPKGKKRKDKHKAHEDKQEESKLHIITLDSKQQEAWRARLEALYPQFYDIVGKELIERIQQVK